MQWKVREEDQKKLTLNTHKGLYKCTRLIMYGLNFAPAKFQRLIESILSGIDGVQVFIDDIRVTAGDDATHLNTLEKIFVRLAKYNVQVNIEKSEFLQDEIEYCGFRLSKLGIHKSESKIEAVKNAPRPTNIQQLQSFLGLVNYYGRFLKNLSTILEPFHKLLRKDAKWCWDEECEKAFLAVKSEMMCDSFLVHYSNELKLVLATDAVCGRCAFAHYGRWY